MLQRIRPAEVKLGMFIEGFEGSWFDHPFWRRRFLLESPEDVAKVRQSGVPAVLVDLARSRIAPPVRPVPASSAAPVPAPCNDEDDDGPCSAADEMARAEAIVRRSKRAVKRMFGEARLGRAIRQATAEALVDEIGGSVSRNAYALISIARLKSKDEYTYMHSVAVCALMIGVARRLGMDEPTVRLAGMAGLLHDVGKMAVADDVLNKPGRLTDSEFAEIRDHPERGHALLVAAGTSAPEVLDVCLHHHEKMDGTGYPEGLRGEAISLLARMGAVCDVYDALTSNRQYKAAWTPAEALDRMVSWDGHFDPPLLQALFDTIGLYPVGTLVRLASGRLAVVAEQNLDEFACPLVVAFYDGATRTAIPPVAVRAGTADGCDTILGRDDPAAWGFADWETRAPALIAGAVRRSARSAAA